MKSASDLTGKRFGSLLVIDRAPDHCTPNGKYKKWNCVCDCGNLMIVFSSNLRQKNGTTKCKSCHYKSTRKHSLSGTFLYSIWEAMKQRCNNPNHKLYHLYGGRGISVCKEWIDDFSKFSEYMGKRPSTKHSVERINNDGNYEPGNVKWATAIEQQSNRRNNRLVTLNGKTLTLAQWSRELGI